MVSILARTIIIYIILSIILRVMGKRQIGELDVGELVSTLLISEIASVTIDDPDIQLLNAFIPILFIFCAEVILSTLKNKSEKLKHAIEGRPVYIIYKGRLLQDALSENRISINELLSEIRSQGIGDISEVNYAVIEQNGSLSILKNGDSTMAHSVIIDGEIIYDTLTSIGYNEEWLNKELKSVKAKKKDVFLMTVTDDKITKVILKNGKEV